MFTLGSLKGILPSDNSTNSLLIGNVVSPMSSVDIRNLAPTARRWYYISNVMRTDFVCQFETKMEARKAFERIKGISYLGHPLEVTFLNCNVSASDPFNNCTKSMPHLFFSLPSTEEFSRRLEEARKLIGSLSPIPTSKQRWVDFTA